MSKIVLITGASRGIGFSLAQQFIAKGFTVIGTSRTGILQNSTTNQLIAKKLNLRDPQSRAEVANWLTEEGIKIDILVNNAGIGPDLGGDKPEAESYKDTFEVNTTGTVFFTELILPHIKKGGKVINISSKMSSIEACGTTDSVAYRMSKAALNMYTKILTNRLDGTQKVAAIHPGWVRTTISESSSKYAPLSTEESAKGIIDFVMGDFRTGTFWNVETQEEIGW